MKSKKTIFSAFIIILVLFAVLSLSMPIDSYETEPGRKWPDSSATALPYYVNPSGTPADVSYINAVNAGSQLWNDVPTSYFAFSYQGTTTVYNIGNRDGMNTWVWNKDGDGMESQTLGTNHFWINTQTQEMIEFDIEINGTSDWAYPETPAAGEYDLLHVTCHEAGHSLWLGHSDIASAMMYAYYHTSRTLHQDDKDGITALYNTNPSPTPTSSASPSPSPTLPPSGGGGGGGGGGCFIATAAYGSYMHDDVMVLRKFRDNVLLKSDAGRSMVRTYYKYSPPMADYIAERPVMKAGTRAALTPLVFLLKYPAQSLLISILAAAGIWFMINNFRKKTAKVKILQKEDC